MLKREISKKKNVPQQSFSRKIVRKNYVRAEKMRLKKTKICRVEFHENNLMILYSNDNRKIS